MDNVLSDIVIALDSWTERIIDAESRIKKTQDIGKSVLDSLNRQVLDGLISEQDAIELEYTCDLWINLYKSFLCHSAGADFADRDMISYLIELYGLKQISKELFVQIVLDLCQNNGRSLNLL